MKLEQGQVYSTERGFLRIVRLERLEVEYKTTKTAKTKDGRHHRASKKEFCRMIKEGTLVDPNAEPPPPNPLDALPPERLKRSGRVR